MELTAEIREAARQEVAEEAARSKMSEKTAASLRNINYEEKLRKQDNEKFAYALTQIELTAENLSKLISRCTGVPAISTLLLPRTQKLLYWIQSRGWRLGHEISTPEDITFLSRLTPDEERMSEAKFAAEWKAKKIVKPISDEPERRRCALGVRKCLKVKDGKAGIVAGTSEWCSADCRGRAKILAKKALEPKPALQDIAISAEATV